MRKTILYGSLEFFKPVYGWRPCFKFYANVEFFVINIYLMEIIHETMGMAIPSMSRMFESYSGVVLHPSLCSHLTKRF
jgi:hypothetical protein